MLDKMKKKSDFFSFFAEVLEVSKASKLCIAIFYNQQMRDQT